MSHPTSPTSSVSAQTEEFVWPQFNTSTRYRRFIERLRLARIERGLSIADMSDEVGLSFKLAYEFENLITPLPFEWLEIWCETVGVPFADYLAIYRADQREWDEGQAFLEIEAQAFAPSTVTHAFCWLSSLRSAVAHTVSRLASLFSVGR
jgi:transcriptional regulator with XRE-family HTH domain